MISTKCHKGKERNSMEKFLFANIAVLWAKRDKQVSISFEKTFLPIFSTTLVKVLSFVVYRNRVLQT